MPGPTGYSALLAALGNPASFDPQAFLTRLQAEYGLAHVLYGDLRRDGSAFIPGRLIHGQDPEFERLIREEGLAVLHPLFEAAARRFGPAVLEPSNRAKTGTDTIRVHPRCRDSRPLLVFPLVPSRPGVAFLAADPGRLEDRREAREILMRDLAALAGLFHARQLALAPLRSQGGAQADARPRLTPREREVLEWVAGGKTYWEIARILGISERTVRHFMSACREKLDAVSNKQAVARAVATGLIEIGYPAPPPRK
ncbi:helix-turn-helix transcriptional regulator [Rhizobium sp. C4]|uniref:helix-turn-helix transcriptional regulator n=1 Tax=Rhizobium sp. C4 TaxID=1349800 RepID=UPI001E623AB2|nr:LuxR C-terminal-related transcriptional regulator [Rhizobium sp. C4]MCD2175233.1 LuxR C-terminal-related transcriptional regulator [Rhizobium sp. C4]